VHEEDGMSADEAINMRSSVHALQSKLSRAAKRSLDRRFGALYDKVYREDVLMEAWLKVRANKGAPGVDEQDFEEIEREIGVTEFLAEIREELRKYRYRPKAVLRCWIDKPGKLDKRPLGIPCIRDRVVQMAVVLVIGPIFETNFLGCSHGFRPGYSQHTAIDAIQKAITFDHLRTVIEGDIVGCFSNLRHDILMRLVARRISDKHLLRLIRAWLKAGVMEDGQYQQSGDAGSPQGGVISPLLSNVYLHSFDKMFQQSGIKGKLIRYADDFVVLLRGDGVRVKLLIGRMLERLGLTMHPEKTRISDARKGFDFLSVHFRVAPVRKRDSKMKEVCVLWPSDKAISRAKEKVQGIIGRQYSLSLEEIIGELNPFIRGWSNYHRCHQKTWVKRRRFRSLDRYAYDRLRFFLKRKYNDQTRGNRRVLGNVPKKVGLVQFG
jgi:group II intron reverse transcriptase/maturase